mgnify:CR=1 FL=1
MIFRLRTGKRDQPTDDTVAVADGFGARTRVTLGGVVREVEYGEGYVTRHYEYTIEQ